MTTLQAKLVTPSGLMAGTLNFEQTISSLTPSDDSAEGYVLPGFIDTHVHGGGGGDTMDGPEGVLTLARFHLSRGTTTLCPTTITSPWEEILAALKGVKTVMRAEDGNLPTIHGVHLEGPFISPERLGAQPPFALEPTADLVEAALEPGVIKLVTLAPELTCARAAARRFAEAGVRVSIGHTNATYMQTRALVEAVKETGGVVGFTHLYNAMTALKSREPGVVGAALSDVASYAELILDTHHVHGASFLAALNAKPDHLHLITDANRACGLGEGKTELGGQEVMVKDGAARLADGTLAGSVLTLDQALRNAVSLGLDIGRVSRLLSDVPARYLGLEDRGRLEPGLRADLVVLDDALEVQAVYVAGRKVV